MNMKTLSLAAGVGSLLFAGVASADYTGLSGELHANGGVSGGALHGVESSEARPPR